MKFKDFIDVAIYDNYFVGVEDSGSIIKEFHSNEKYLLEEYVDYIVTGIWILNECAMAVSILKGE